MLSIALVIAVDANSAHATLQERKRKRKRKSKRKRKRKTWRKEGRKEGRKEDILHHTKDRCFRRVRAKILSRGEHGEHRECSLIFSATITLLPHEI